MAFLPKVNLGVSSLLLIKYCLFISSFWLFITDLLGSFFTFSAYLITYIIHVNNPKTSKKILTNIPSVKFIPAVFDAITVAKGFTVEATDTDSYAGGYLGYGGGVQINLPGCRGLQAGHNCR